MSDEVVVGILYPGEWHGDPARFEAAVAGLEAVDPRARVIAEPYLESHELRTLREWEAEGLIRMTPFKVSCTKAFWELMQEVVWLGYVTYDEAGEH